MEQTERPTFKAIACVLGQLLFAILGAVSSIYSLSGLKTTHVGSIISNWGWGLGFLFCNVVFWVLACLVKEDEQVTPPQPVELDRLPAPGPPAQPVPTQPTRPTQPVPLPQRSPLNRPVPLSQSLPINPSIALNRSFSVHQSTVSL
jgi:hypothetical protein